MSTRAKKAEAARATPFAWSLAPSAAAKPKAPEPVIVPALGPLGASTPVEAAQDSAEHLARRAAIHRYAFLNG
jgi:hypothetical protein